MRRTLRRDAGATGPSLGLLTTLAAENHEPCPSSKGMRVSSGPTALNESLKLRIPSARPLPRAGNFCGPKHIIAIARNTSRCLGLEQIFDHRFEPPISVSLPTKAAERPAVRPRPILHDNLCLALSCIGCVRQIQQQFGKQRRVADNNVRLFIAPISDAMRTAVLTL